jgi:hypothetical protein
LFVGLTQASHGGHTVARGGGRHTAAHTGGGEGDLDVARDVVRGRTVHTAHTVSAAHQERTRGHQQLHLAETTARRHERLAHVAQDGLTRRVRERGGDGAAAVDVRGDGGSRIRASVGVERGHQGTHVDVVTRIQRNLLCVRDQGRHSSIPLSEKKILAAFEFFGGNKTIS